MPRELAAIQISKASFQYRGEPVLRELTCSIPAGRWTCLAGGNGSGKSTLVRLIAGLLPLREGRIEVLGIPLTKDTVWDIRKKVRMVFANPDHQFVGLTVEDDLAFGLENLGASRAEIKRRMNHYAALLRIDGLLGRHPSTLSGGQKQRVAIAAALMMEPEIIIFDEAASMLDERSRQELVAIMKQIAQIRKYTLLAVTHDWEEMTAADHMIVLKDGRIAAEGQPADLLRRQELLRACRLHPPAPLQLCLALKKQGIDIGEYLTEREVIDALWEFISKTSLASIARRKVSS